MPRTLFRHEAMERLGSPEQLDTLMRVVDPRRWVALVAIGVILAGAVVWALVGRLESTARTSACVVIPRGGTYTIQAAVAGTVLSVLVQRGDHVNEGQTVAIIETPNGSKAPVEAPFSGTVIELLETHSDYVSVGGQIVSFESDEEALGVLVYVSPAMSASLHPGMEVRVSPATASRDHYGFLLGTVEEVAPYPSTREGIASLLHNDALARRLVTAAGGTPVEVWVAPQKARTPSGTETGMTHSNDRRHEVADRLTSRAASDPAFRRRLMDDAHGAVEDELGIALPGDVTLTVLEESADQLYLVLPATSSSDSSGQLSDAQLSGVAGGNFEDFWNNLHWPTVSPC